MRTGLALLATVLWLALAACESPRPFQPDKGRLPPDAVQPPASGATPAARDRPEVAVEAPKGMAADNAARLAMALVVELRRHDVVATTSMLSGLPRLGGQVTTGPFDGGTEIKVRWTLYDQKGTAVDELEYVTTGRAEDWDRGSDRMISRFANRAAPDVAMRLGKSPAPAPPEEMSWSVLPGMPPPPGEKRPPGGLPVIPDLPPVSETPAAASADDAGKAVVASRSAVPLSRFPKIQVLPVTGAPGDGNATLAKAMRRSLGTNRMILVDRIDPQAFTIGGVVSITAPQDGKQRISIKWTLRDPAGAVVGDMEQANNIPAGSLNGPWGGLADVIAIAATDAVLELVRRARAAAR